MIKDTSSPSAGRVVPLVTSLFPFKSVVDVGCGEGAWLREFRNAGVEDFLGIDGDYVDRTRLLIPSSAFESRDLSRPFKLERTFDLAISLEVAEHLPERSATDFVRSLTALSAVVVFSAAIPQQGGTFHLNEQWPDYWADKFTAFGFDCFDILRDKIWDDDQVDGWYRQNMVIYAKSQTPVWKHLSVHRSPRRPLRLIHPWLYSYRLAECQRQLECAKAPRIRDAARMLIAAMRRRLSHKERRDDRNV